MDRVYNFLINKRGRFVLLKTFVCVLLVNLVKLVGLSHLYSNSLFPLLSLIKRKEKQVLEPIVQADL